MHYLILSNIARELKNKNGTKLELQRIAAEHGRSHFNDSID